MFLVHGRTNYAHVGSYLEVSVILPRSHHSMFGDHLPCGLAGCMRCSFTLKRHAAWSTVGCPVFCDHRKLEGDSSRLMWQDGVHLNEIRLDIFLSGLQDGKEQAMFLFCGGRILVKGCMSSSVAVNRY